MSLFVLPVGLRILDLSAGAGAVWFDRPSNVVAIDLCPGVANVIADSRALPFGDDSFDLAVFDPPHVNFGASANLTRNYGHFTAAQIRELVAGTSREAARCIRALGLLALKWNNHDTPLVRVLGLMPEWRPLFGHHVAQRHSHPSSTYWLMMLNRKSAEVADAAE